ncbi:uncharacterized protein LAJ45_01709 [Morchella importuna]|uniref:Ribosomal protein/NADH dehydrogenase domain-containing protein n=1 Tax=Morchella conica CCBAS932 TaxID=1392247 RepID=A0A3N4KW04_9PEZI|nr:uncharacterized protein LAJ45_01709 [Morchella importuna]KAH8153942.1 hypothetical protein LAJ45_01709 [Morchella importuna]RPB13599.1 hypothetical protein P167DRAFT_521528 [Morchella conica CCBAS932]
MVAIKIRMQYLRGQLAIIRSGKGAAIMAPGVKRIALEFPFKNQNGAMGPRKFWQKYMPALKYHNPNVQMDVHRSRDPMTPSTLTIEFDGDRKEVLNVQHKDNTDICTTVLELTKATPVPTSEEDAALIREYEQLKKRDIQKVKNRESRIAAEKEAKRTGAGKSPLMS